MKLVWYYLGKLAHYCQRICIKIENLFHIVVFKLFAEKISNPQQSISGSTMKVLTVNHLHPSFKSRFNCKNMKEGINTWAVPKKYFISFNHSHDISVASISLIHICFYRLIDQGILLMHIVKHNFTWKWFVKYMTFAGHLKVD